MASEKVSPNFRSALDIAIKMLREHEFSKIPEEGHKDCILESEFLTYMDEFLARPPNLTVGFKWTAVHILRHLVDDEFVSVWRGHIKPRTKLLDFTNGDGYVHRETERLREEMRRLNAAMAAMPLSAHGKTKTGPIREAAVLLAIDILGSLAEGGQMTEWELLQQHGSHPSARINQAFIDAAFDILTDYKLIKKGGVPPVFMSTSFDPYSEQALMRINLNSPAGFRAVFKATHLGLSVHDIGLEKWLGAQVVMPVHLGPSDPRLPISHPATNTGTSSPSSNNKPLTRLAIWAEENRGAAILISGAFALILVVLSSWMSANWTRWFPAPPAEVIAPVPKKVPTSEPKPQKLQPVGPRP